MHCDSTSGPGPLNNDLCGVCLDPMLPDSKTLTHRECRVTTHRSCLDTWLQSCAEKNSRGSCPSCRKSIALVRIITDPSAAPGVEEWQHINPATSTHGHGGPSRDLTWPESLLSSTSTSTNAPVAPATTLDERPIPSDDIRAAATVSPSEDSWRMVNHARLFSDLEGSPDAFSFMCFRQHVDLLFLLNADSHTRQHLGSDRNGPLNLTDLNEYLVGIYTSVDLVQLLALPFSNVSPIHREFPRRNRSSSERRNLYEARGRLQRLWRSGTLSFAVYRFPWLPRRFPRWAIITHEQSSVVGPASAERVGGYFALV